MQRRAAGTQGSSSSTRRCALRAASRTTWKRWEAGSPRFHEGEEARSGRRKNLPSHSPEARSSNEYDRRPIELLARSTLRASANGGGYALRCPCEYEAQVFEFFFAWSMTVDFEPVTCPVRIIGSDPTVRNSFMPSMDLGELVALDYDFLPETSHLLQLEQPEECAARVLDFIEQYNLAP